MPNRSPGCGRHRAAAALAALLAGCAAPAPAPPPPEIAAAELVSVPFFPQTRHQCGPAALATVLAWSGQQVTPEQLEPELYVPGRKGAFQPEILAAARARSRVPYVLAASLEDLLLEVAAGNPVLVLQNLGLSWLPVWHYAVVVGYDAQRRELVLRSGKERRRTTPLAAFRRSWDRAGNWAVVVTAPDRIARTAQETRHLAAIMDFEELGQWESARIAYQSAAARWPASPTARVGLGNAYYHAGRWADAERAYRDALAGHPATAAVYNNLAQTLAEQGRFEEAEAAIRSALALGGPHSDTFAETRAEIARRRAAGAARE